MKRLVEPAARAARAGFPLSDFQAYLFTVIGPILTASESVERIFAPGGKLMTGGEVFRNEELGECLEWVAEDGVRLFIDGDVGRTIVAEQFSGGGHLRTMILRATARRSARRFIGGITARPSRSTRRPRQAARSSPTASLISKRSRTAAARSIHMRSAAPWRL